MVVVTYKTSWVGSFGSKTFVRMNVEEAVSSGDLYDQTIYQRTIVEYVGMVRAAGRKIT